MRQSAISYYADMVLCPLLALGLSLFACGWYAEHIVQWFAMLLIGVGLWTFIEYLMHRLVYHQVPVFKKYHEVHHADPQAYVGAPPIVGTSVVFLVSFMPPLAISPIAANGLSAGMLVGYTAYMLVHHACHFWQPTPASYLYRLRHRHAVHHYRDDSGNFGVTTAFWDRVFGTNIQTSTARKLAT
jgi:sterol desaturase/sphingolipid hydroxylase (fatty acid hydroxylase superfamily)